MARNGTYGTAKLARARKKYAKKNPRTGLWTYRNTTYVVRKKYEKSKEN